MGGSGLPTITAAMSVRQDLRCSRVRGIDDTRATLKRWSAHSGARDRRLGFEVVRRGVRPVDRGVCDRELRDTRTPTPLLIPGVTRPPRALPRSARCSFATRWCSPCTASPASPASSPAARCRSSAVRRSGPWKRDPRLGGDARDLVRGARQRRRSRRRHPRHWRASLGEDDYLRAVAAQLGPISPGVLLATLSLHAVPELTALFLPLAAWLVASRRGRWSGTCSQRHLRHRGDRRARCSSPPRSSRPT